MTFLMIALLALGSEPKFSKPQVDPDFPSVPNGFRKYLDESIDSESSDGLIAINHFLHLQASLMDTAYYKAMERSSSSKSWWAKKLSEAKEDITARQEMILKLVSNLNDQEIKEIRNNARSFIEDEKERLEHARKTPNTLWKVPIFEYGIRTKTELLYSIENARK